jgi:hypothetical protein
MTAGAASFIAGLQALGLEAEARNGVVLIRLDIGPPSAPGPHQVGTDPPDDYPRVPPHWLHLPRGLVLTEDPGRASELGEEWWKWSRAHPKWKVGGDPARLWLAHARSLLLQAEAA